MTDLEDAFAAVESHSLSPQPITGESAFARLKIVCRERPDLRRTAAHSNCANFTDSNGEAVEIDIGTHNGKNGVLIATGHRNGMPRAIYFLDSSHIPEARRYLIDIMNAQRSGMEWPEENRINDFMPDRTLMAIGAFVVGLIAGSWLATKKIH